MVQLGEVLSQYTEYIDTPEPREYRKLSVKLYGRGVILDAPANGATLKMMRHQIAKSGQVILSEIWGKKGAIGFVPEEGDGALCTSHFFLFDTAIDKLDRRWLQAIFDANYLQAQLDAEAKGTTGYAAVRPKILLACEIPLPPLPEQRRIVARIEQLAVKINEARGLRYHSLDEANTLFRKSISSIIGSGWPEVRLEEACDPVRPITYGIVQAGHHVPDGVPYIRVSDMAKSELTLAGMLRTAPHIAESYRRSAVREGDIVFAIRATVGKMRFVPKDLDGANLTQGTARIAPSERAIAPYLFWVLQTQSVVDSIDSVTKGSTFREITLGKLRTIPIPLPPLSEQLRIVNELDAVKAQIDALKQLQAETAAELAALLPSVLDKAFKGEL
jgi:type I restriction enzyme S subunit